MSKEKYKRCDKCKGKGFISAKGLRIIKCKVCKGTGKIKIE